MRRLFPSRCYFIRNEPVVKVHGGSPKLISFYRAKYRICAVFCLLDVCSQKCLMAKLKQLHASLLIKGEKKNIGCQ